MIPSFLTSRTCGKLLWTVPTLTLSVLLVGVRGQDSCDLGQVRGWVSGATNGDEKGVVGVSP